MNAEYLKVSELDEKTYINADNLGIVFTMFEKQLISKCRQVYYKYSYSEELWFTYKDLFTDTYLKMRNNLKADNVEFESLDNFFAYFYTSCKRIFIDYIIRKKRAKVRVEDVSYNYLYKDDYNDILDNIFDAFCYSKLEYDISAYKNKLEYDTDKYLLNALTKNWSNEKICKGLKVSRGNLRAAVFRFRNRFFKILQEDGVIPTHIKYEDIPKSSKPFEDVIENGWYNRNYLINDYPFESSDEEKIRCILDNFNNLKFNDIFMIYNTNIVSNRKITLKNVKRQCMHELHKLRLKGLVSFVEGHVELINKD